MATKSQKLAVILLLFSTTHLFLSQIILHFFLELSFVFRSQKVVTCATSVAPRSHHSPIIASVPEEYFGGARPMHGTLSLCGRPPCALLVGQLTEGELSGYVDESSFGLRLC